MSAAPWSEFHRRWAQLKPPLRPNAEIVAALKAAIAGHDGHVLQLGLTPELTAIAKDTVAVDWSATTLAFVWPGNTATRRAVRANWLHMPLAACSFTAAIGDGSLNCLDYPKEYARIFAELSRVLRPGARLAIRMYLTPHPCESLDALRDAAMAGAIGVMDALKWRLANAICAERRTPNVAVRAIFDVFNRLFPDRAALGRACRWTPEHIAQIDRYETLPDVFSFPAEAEVLQALPPGFAAPGFAPSGTYELAERCPILTATYRP
jgi:SAM-dependent methyltransferase